MENHSMELIKSVNGKFRRSCWLSSFITKDSDSDISFLYHVHIIGSISDG